MLFSTNIFIWTAVSCNCSEGTAASELHTCWGWQKLLSSGSWLDSMTNLQPRVHGVSWSFGNTAGSSAGSHHRGLEQGWGHGMGWDTGHGHPLLNPRLVEVGGTLGPAGPILPQQGHPAVLHSIMTWWLLGSPRRTPNTSLWKQWAPTQHSTAS